MLINKYIFLESLFKMFSRYLFNKHDKSKYLIIKFKSCLQMHRQYIFLYLTF